MRFWRVRTRFRYEGDQTEVRLDLRADEARALASGEGDLADRLRDELKFLLDHTEHSDALITPPIRAPERRM